MNKIMPIKDEIVYLETLANGLKIYLHPKKDFIDYYCTLQINIGGNALDYTFNNERFTLPDGTAHFLEHVYFEDEGINLADIFSKLNGDINASTSRDVTKYYFKAQENFKELLLIFLNHFSKVRINQTTVDKERLIIEKEIMMYDDNIYSKAHDELTEKMYLDKKIWVDLAGTAETIAEINVDVLNQAVKHFYQPQNMTLVITGSFENEDILDIIKNSNINKITSNTHLPKLSFSLLGDKKHHVYKVNKKQDVEYVVVGLKINLEDFKHLSKSEMRLSIIMFLEYFFDESSSNYKNLKREKLINYMYGTSISIKKDYAYFTVSSESKYPKKLKNRLIEMLLNVEDVDSGNFLSFKRARMGNFIGYFDNPLSINHMLTNFLHKGIDIDKYLDNLKNVSLNNLEFLRKSMIIENIYSLIYAKK